MQPILFFPSCAAKYPTSFLIRWICPFLWDGFLNNAPCNKNASDQCTLLAELYM